MELLVKKQLHVVSGRANEPLGAAIAERLGVELGEAHLESFSDGELHCRFGDSVRGMHLFVVQSHGSTPALSVNDAILEHLIMVDAARRASAKHITAVMPFYGYSRQDRKAEGREPITAKLVANMFVAAGADRLVSIDLHSGQIQGFFDQPFDHLTAMPVLVDYLANHITDDLVVVSPDAGRVKVAERYANVLHADLAIVHKRRERGVKNAIKALEVVGDVAGRPCVLIDDLIDTGRTLVAAAELLVEQGAREVSAAATHGVLSGDAIDRLKNSIISRVIVTDTLPMPSEKQVDKFEVLSVAPIIADAIEAVFADTSVSEIFDGANQS